MKIAVISDIHSNKFALEKVLDDIKLNKCDLICCLGDIFGYYPWAYETYELLQEIEEMGLFIKGNHDVLVEKMGENESKLEYYSIALQNREILAKKGYLSWLSHLPISLVFQLKKYKIYLYHGTPNNPLEGRFYPDDNITYDWFPSNKEIILLGHTHYSLIKKIRADSWIINPGSVGQPRDGDTRASWTLLDLTNMSIENRRVEYPIMQAIEELNNMNWNNRAIKALQKNYKGNLKV
ncbi:MAG: metallophosphatase family protein [Candidatus Calescibacterium sp.]|nr:metallophosphatase family protein [Candidatus Calescibacterium sp.]